MSHAARSAALAIVLVVGIVSGALFPSSCATFNPGGVVRCMENSKDEKAAEQLVFAMLDKDAFAALEAALSLAPDLVKCLLQRTASLKSAGGVAGERAKKAQQFLDSHGLSTLMRCGGVEPRLAHNQETAGSSPAGATTTRPWRGFCPMPGCATDDPLPPGIGPGAGGG